MEALAEKTGLALANCSQHLQQLRRAGLVAARRDGRAVIYRLTDGRTLALMEMLGTVAACNLAQVERILRGLAGEGDAPEPVGRDELARRLAEGSATVLDVLPADEFAAGHIAGAISVPLAELGRRLPVPGPGREIVAYCRAPFCADAHRAVAELRRLGLAARRLEGGLPEWRAEGRPVQTCGR